MINFEWGRHGLEKCSATSDAVIIIDVLSFSTCVDIVTEKGGCIFPYRYKDDTSVEYAKSVNAHLTSFKRSSELPSLSPVSLKNIPPGSRIVLPSPNGSELTLLSGSKLTICACLRNFTAVAGYVNTLDGNITVIAAGEKWPDGSIRFAIEDFLGAGAVLSLLQAELSIEAQACRSFFTANQQNTESIIYGCISGRELAERGFKCDVDAALELNISGSIPVLHSGCYIDFNKTNLF